MREYVQLHIGQRPYEVFAVLFLDAQHRLLALEEMFRGTLSQTSVYPREVVLRALRMKKLAGDLCMVLGGRHTHPVTLKVGGFSRVPSRRPSR